MGGRVGVDGGVSRDGTREQHRGSESVGLFLGLGREGAVTGGSCREYGEG